MQESRGQLMPLSEFVQRVRCTFLEDPGSRLSMAQASRLTGIEPSECGRILETLNDTHFLKLGTDGTFTLR
jgi:hypothetical protein